MSKRLNATGAQLAPSNEIICGDSKDVVRAFAPDSIDCVVTSPPYFQQRNYGSDDEVGSEATPEAYIESVTDVIMACHRALRPSGTLWLNLGDKYVSNALLGLPWRIALNLVARGWLLRSDIIWHKPNAMPHPTTSRPTVDHEYMFLLTKTSSYFYDADAIREPHVTFSSESKMRGGRKHLQDKNGTPEKGKFGGRSNLHSGAWDKAFHPLGRNKRTVWTIPLGKYRGAHFAVFPEALVQPCILAGCPSDGIVLDPFFGSGTVGLVAAKLGHKFVGVEKNPEYVRLARERLSVIQPRLL